MKVTAKRVLRVVQVLLLLLLIAYLAVLGSANPQTIDPLFLIPLPTVWIISGALLLGFLLGYLSLLARVLRLQRENRRLRQYLIKAGLEAEGRQLEAPLTGRRDNETRRS